MKQMFLGTSKFLWALLDEKQNLVFSGYRKAHKLIRKNKYAVNAGYRAHRDSFLTKILYQVNFINQNMYKKIKQVINSTLRANANTMIIFAN